MLPESNSKLSRPAGINIATPVPLLESNDLRFVALNLRTVPHLEALLILRDVGDQDVSPEEISQRLYIPTDLAAEVLLDLANRRLATGTAELKFRFAPCVDDAASIERIAAAYRRHIVRLSNFILEESASLRDAANSNDALNFPSIENRSSEA
jgi:hypothetical protein